MSDKTHSCSNAGQRVRRRFAGGFTLVELLVVIGIIALLISILLPALNKAKEAARMVNCLANLRSMAQAAILHANDHKGYMPVAGATFVPSAPSCTPIGLHDANSQRYSYYTDGGQQRPMGLAGSFAKYVGQRVRTDSKANLEADLNTGQVAKMFICPSDKDNGWLGFTIAEYTGGVGGLWSGPVSRQSYAFNEGVLGIAEPGDASGVSQAGCRLRGNLARVRRSAETFLQTDSTNLRGGGGPGIMVYYNLQFDQTLGDVYRGTGAGDAVNFDRKRHNGRININFCDGHAETFKIEPKALSKVYLVTKN
jgi:prepilin-type processing-associated H-X9-DG protein/prepilin-type N-terminal cleavage/methylation domain-containing protein